MLSQAIKACRLLFQGSWHMKTIHLADWEAEIRGDTFMWPWEDTSLPAPSRPFGNEHLLDKTIYLQQTSITAVCWTQPPPKMADLGEQCQDVGRALTFDPAWGEISTQLRCVIVIWAAHSSGLAWTGAWQKDRLPGRAQVPRLSFSRPVCRSPQP